MHGEIRAALANPKLREQLSGGLACEPHGNPPAEFRQFLESAIRRAGELTRIAGIQAE